jgi:hypothetical protein
MRRRDGVEHGLGHGRQHAGRHAGRVVARGIGIEKRDVESGARQGQRHRRSDRAGAGHRHPRAQLGLHGRQTPLLAPNVKPGGPFCGLYGCVRGVTNATAWVYPVLTKLDHTLSDRAGRAVAGRNVTRMTDKPTFRHGSPRRSLCRGAPSDPSQGPGPQPDPVGRSPGHHLPADPEIRARRQPHQRVQAVRGRAPAAVAGVLFLRGAGRDRAGATSTTVSPSA